MPLSESTNTQTRPTLSTGAAGFTGSAGVASNGMELEDLMLDSRFVDDSSQSAGVATASIPMTSASRTNAVPVFDVSRRPQFTPVSSSRMGPRQYDLAGQVYRLSAMGGVCLYKTVLQALKSIRREDPTNVVHSIPDADTLLVRLVEHLSRNREVFVPLFLEQLVNFVNQRRLELFPPSLQAKLDPFVKIIRAGGDLSSAEVIDSETELGRQFSDIMSTCFTTLAMEGNWAVDLEIVALQEILETKLAIHTQSTNLTIYYSNAEPVELYLLFDGVHYDFLTPTTATVVDVPIIERAELNTLEERLFKAAETRNLIADISFNSQTNAPEASIELAGTRFEMYRTNIDNSNCPYAAIWHVARTSARTQAMMAERYPERSSLRQKMASILRTSQAFYLGLVSAQIMQAIDANELHLLDGQLKTFAETQQLNLKKPGLSKIKAQENFLAAVKHEGYEAYCNFMESRNNHWLRSLEIGMLADLLGLEILLYMPDRKTVIRSHKAEKCPRVHLYWTGSEHKLLSVVQKFLTHDANPFTPLSSSALRAATAVPMIEGETALNPDGSARISAVNPPASASVASAPIATSSELETPAGEGAAAHPRQLASAQQQQCLTLLFEKAKTFVAPGLHRVDELAKLMPEKSFSLSPFERAAIEQDYAIKKSVLLTSARLIRRAQSIMGSYNVPQTRIGFILSFEELQQRIRIEAARIIEDYRARYIKRLENQGVRWSDGELLSARSWTKKTVYKKAYEQAVNLFNVDVQARMNEFLELDAAYKLYEYASGAPEFTDEQRATSETQIAIQEAKFAEHLATAQTALIRAQEGMSLGVQLDLSDGEAETAQALQRQQDDLFRWSAVEEFLRKYQELLNAYRSLSTQDATGGLNTVEPAFKLYLNGDEEAATPNSFCQPRSAVELQKQFFYLLKVFADFKHSDLDKVIGDFDGAEPLAGRPARLSRLFPGFVVGSRGYSEAIERLREHFVKKIEDVLRGFSRVVRAWNITQLDTDPVYQRLFIRDQLESLDHELLALKQESDTLEKQRSIHSVQLQTELPINNYELQKHRLRIMLPEHVAEVEALALSDTKERLYSQHNTCPEAVELLREHYRALSMEQATDLIVYGLPASYRDRRGRTLLHYAVDCRFDDYDQELEAIVRHLLNLNAPVALKDGDGMSPGALICFHAPSARSESSLDTTRKTIRETLLELLARADSCSRLQQKVQDFAHTYGIEMERVMIEELAAGENSTWKIGGFMFAWRAADRATKRKETIGALRNLIYQTARANHNLFEVFDQVLAHVERINKTYGHSLRGSNMVRLVRDLTLTHAKNTVFQEAVFDLVQARNRYFDTIEGENRDLPARLADAARLKVEQQLKDAQAEADRLRKELAAATQENKEEQARTAEEKRRTARAEARLAELRAAEGPAADDSDASSTSVEGVGVDLLAADRANGPGFFTGPRRRNRVVPSMGIPAPTLAP